MVVNSPKIIELGEVYTNNNTVINSIDEIFKDYNFQLNHNWLDIGTGSGAFLVELIDRRIELLRSLGKSDSEIFKNCVNHISAYEINDNNLNKLFQNCRDTFQRNGFQLTKKEFSKIVKFSDFLFHDIARRYDIITGNIPFVRYDNLLKYMGSEYIKELKQRYLTFVGRCDYCVPFFEKSIDILTEDGRIGIISSKQWTKTNYGLVLRNMIFNNFHLKVRPIASDEYQQEVRTYSALFQIKLKNGSSNSLIFELAKSKDDSVIRSINKQKIVIQDQYSGIWLSVPSEIKNILNKLLKLPRLFDCYDVGKGLSTGAQKILVKTIEEWNEEEIKGDDLVEVVDSTQIRTKAKRYLLKVHNLITGDILEKKDLSKPVQKYLDNHENILKQRYFVKNVPNSKWWDTIDRFNLKIFSASKFIFPNTLQGNIVKFQCGNIYPGNDVTWVIVDSKMKTQMSSILKSPIFKIWREFGGPEYGNNHRWSTKLIKSVPIPKKIQKDVPINMQYGLTDGEWRKIQNHLNKNHNATFDD